MRSCTKKPVFYIEICLNDKILGVKYQKNPFKIAAALQSILQILILEKYWIKSKLSISVPIISHAFLEICILKVGNVWFPQYIEVPMLIFNVENLSWSPSVETWDDYMKKIKSGPLLIFEWTIWNHIDHKG